MPRAARGALAESSWIEHLDPKRVRASLRAELGVDVEPRPALGRDWWRVDAGRPVAIAPHELGSQDCPALSGLRDGDLVLARHARAQGLGTSLALAEFTWFGHMGIVALEAGEVVVYESWATIERLGPSEDFAGRFRGGPRRTPLPRFLRDYEELAFLRVVEAAAGTEWVDAARASLARGLRFDPYHEAGNEALDCCEYVLELADEIGVELAPPSVALTSNPSVRAIQAALGFRVERYVVPDGFLNLPSARVVACLSRHPSRERSLAAREAGRLLHAMVQGGARVADVLALDRWRLLRPRANVRDFLAFVDALAAERPTRDPQRLEAELRRMLPIFFRPRDAARAPGLDAPLRPWHGALNWEATAGEDAAPDDGAAELSGRPPP